MKLRIFLKEVILLVALAYSLLSGNGQAAGNSDFSEGIALYEDLQQTQDIELHRKFVADLNKIHDLNQLKKYLNTDDAQNARLVIRRIAVIGKSRATMILEDLWEGGKTYHALDHKGTYNKPVARLMLAQQLLTLKPRKKYAEYIKSFASDRNWVVRSSVAEALVSVDDMDAVELLVEIAKSAHYFVAQAGLEALVQIAQIGRQSQTAIREIKKLSNDPYITDAQFKDDIEKAYQLLSRHALFVPDIRTTEAFSVQKTPRENSIDQIIQPFLQARDIGAAIDRLLPYAQRDNARAQHLVGDMYLVLDKPDYKNAIIWLSKAINNDYAPAKFSMANLYLSGRGVKKDVDEAVRLLTEAERQGDKSAQALLNTARGRGWWGLRAVRPYGVKGP